MASDEYFSKSSVPYSPEFYRIHALPSREPPRLERDALVKEVSARLRVTGSMSELFPVQAYTLLELAEQRGFFGPITVGGGKTLITLLAPVVLGAKLPVLLVPGALLGRDLEKKLQEYGRLWQIAHNLRIVSYDAVSRVGGENLLAGADLILGDEAHRLKNPRAAVTRKVARYFEQHPGTMGCFFSGTFLTHSIIKDCSHIAKWAHKERSPFPQTPREIYEWSEAIDVPRVSFRRRPGVLLGLGGTDARSSFHRRMVSCAGVIVAGGDDVGASIRVKAIPYEVNLKTSEHFTRLREYAERPDGFALTEQVRVWACARELALGFHSEWDPQAPREWLAARKAWAKYVRGILAENKEGLDSELAIVNWVDREGTNLFLEEWRAIRATFEVNPKDTWHDDTALGLCEKWGKKEPGIIWVEHVFFGKELARRTGWSYFGAGGLDKAGLSIVDSIRTTIIASVDANRTGRNLQDRWSRNLITSPESLAKDWEQLMGRTHRAGQMADEVEFDVLLGCSEHDASFKKALVGAKQEKEIFGHVPKLMLSDITWPDELPSNKGAWG